MVFADIMVTPGLVFSSVRERKNSCNMTKFSNQIEMTVYRFILSLVFGIFVGSYLISNHENPIIKTLGKFVCTDHQLYRTTKQLQNNIEGPPRPQQLNSESGILYIGMMSMKKYIETRVAATSHTWAKNHNIRLDIFASNNGTIGPRSGRISHIENGARIIQLPGVSDVSYPPQKKSFSMLKFIHDNHLEKFDWFLRLDDDAYVNVDKLVKLLGRADPKKPLFIGHAGYGKHAEDYLADGENYCMGGTGIIFSRELLRRVGPNLATCLNDMYTEHEDIELGRCVRKITKVSCTEAWETTNLFFQNYVSEGTYDSNIKEISESKRRIALTFHANKDPKYQYKLHQQILKDKVTTLFTRITRMETEVKKMSNLLQMKKFDSMAWNSRAGYVWDDITRKSQYSTSFLVRGIPAGIKNAAIFNVYSTMQELRVQNPALQTHIREISVMHMRYFVNPLTSVDMITRLKVRVKEHKKDHSYNINLKQVHYRRTFPSSVIYVKENHPLNIQQLRDEARKSNANAAKMVSGPNTAVNFIMSLSGRPDNLIRFLQNFKDVFLSSGENATLTVVYFPSPGPATEAQIIDADEAEAGKNVSRSEEIQFIKLNLDQVRKDFPKSEINLISVKNGMPFSRGMGLQMGAKAVSHPGKKDELLFFCDVDLIFTVDILHHIRRSTIVGKQVYYPTFFSQYNPNVVYSYHESPKTQFYFEEIAGFWRTFSYGMVSIYKSDFLKSGGFDLSIKGWGLEDIRLCDAVLKKANVHIFKSPEPAMVHIYHDKECPAELSAKQLSSCQNSRAQHYGPQALLYYLWHRGLDGEDDEDDPNVKVDT